MSKFEVLPNRKYLIVEKPDDATPSELKAVGRAKRGGGFFELAGCPFDASTGKYNTGLDRYSREFNGMSDKEVDKILKDRKDLVSFYQRKLETSGKKEIDFLANFKLELKHNTLVDTSDPNQYLKLFLACRGNKITPQGQEGNVGKYGSSMYVIIDSDKTQDLKAQATEMEFEIIEWLGNKLRNNREDAIAILKYEDIIGIRQDKKDSLIKQTVKKKIQDFNVLSKLMRTIKEVPMEEVHLTVDIRKAVTKGVIRKESSGYFFDNIDLGKDIRAIVRTLQKPENSDILERLLN